MAYQGIPLGRAGGVKIASGGGGVGDTPIKLEGLTEFLRKAAKADDRFNTEIRKASMEVAQILLVAAQYEASTVTRNRQAIGVMKGMRVKSDRVPALKLAEKTPFSSRSRPNSKRKRKVTKGDVFFGAEFGGGARPTTQQFLRHRGRSGYFFWPTVRKKKNEIATEYLNAIDRVLNFLAER